MKKRRQTPLISVVMGSDSDLPIVQEAVKVFEEFKIPYEVLILSAHRSPNEAHKYVKKALKRGIQVIIACAGGAAHLAGLIASYFPLPVIGVPIKSKFLNGIDSLYSTVQMPPGVPVATVGINAAKNAALLAIRILAISDKNLQRDLKRYKRKLEKEVIKKTNKLEAIGITAYIKSMPERNILQSEIIQETIPNVFKTINIRGVGKKYSGKVRDFYFLNNNMRVLVTTDRQSAFDVILGHIPYKGAVLNLLSKFWFEKTKHIVDNHMIDVPDPNVLVARNCRPIPVEMIVRGFMTGVTKTSIWYSYERGERIIYGLKFPEELQRNQKLPKPIITPTTHPEAGSGGHDERLTREKILKQKIVPRKLYEQMEKAALALFAFGTRRCRNQDLILVDTKFEFGLHDGKLMLIDELFTPDSSRFWVADTYKEHFLKGLEPENFDKEFLRLRYANELGYRGVGEPPEIPKDLIIDLAIRYITVYEKITGKKFKLFDYPIEKRIKRNIEKYLSAQV